MIVGYCTLMHQCDDLQLEDSLSVRKASDVKTAHMGAKLHADFAMDYFITPRHGFPWRDMPALVIGRPEVDNYIVSLSATNQTAVNSYSCLLTNHVNSDFHLIM